MSADSTSPDNAVSLRGVGKVFRRKGQTTVALRDVQLDVARGEFVSLLGPSGCGKSTLLRVIGGLTDCDVGTVTVGGSTPADARADKQFGLVPQAPALLPWHSVAKNARFLAELHRSKDHPGLPDAEIDALLESVGLSGFTRALPHELSGGMQQRVSLVRAFALGAQILLMDEPFDDLDEITRADMRYLLLDLWQRLGATVVFVTHSVTESVILSDRVVVMAPRPGRVVTIEDIDLPRPRTPDMEDDPTFHEHVRRLRSDLRETHAR
ncbi:MAG: putative transporter ATP-binding protein [Ilumatobacteraceae bacterium]|nr:putative transporter ATP-binding protein [Ilumatobacteraceae bacterium]